MKRWLPVLLVGGIVVVVAVGAYLALGRGDAPSEQAEVEAPASTVVVRERSGGAASDEGEELRPSPNDGPVPPRGTLRPMNKGETEMAARLARPINVHAQYVGSWWGQIQRELREDDPDLAISVEELTGYLRDQTRRNDDTLDVNAVLEREMALEAEIRAKHAAGDPRLTAMLDYVKASAEAVKAGQDPAKVEKPDVPK